ncbi:SDR family NAD(P)-dependent oxidoreductase [Candidatus Pelagibacter sp.]|nr:SDR family NAD(P)-dependent oxidoreductase [Candidatus Pelagibacter sp.]
MNNNTIIFEEKHLDSFCNFSKDKNPLHINNEYAALTPFSERIVYGIVGVFFLLSKINYKNLNIHYLSADFRNPLFINKEYYFAINKKNNEINLKLFKGTTIYTKLKIKIRNKPINIPGKSSLLSFKDKSYISNDRKWNIIPEKKKLKKLLNFFPDLKDSKFWLLQVLAWSSYWVGMISPGRQALYTQFKLDIKHSNIKFKHEEEQFHEVFKQNKSIFKTPRGSKITITSFLRPKPLSHLKSFIFEKSDKSEMKDTLCFVTGGTRGVGSVFSQIFSSKGATVLSSYKRDKKSAQKIEKFILSKGKNFKALRFDQKLQLHKSLLDKKLDCLVLNAAPNIKKIDLSEMSSKEFNNEISQFVNLTINDIKFFQNYITKDTTIINISSTYIDEKPMGYSHYYKAKKSIEKYLKDFSDKNPKLTLLNFRLPKLLTDQTNVNSVNENIASPVVVIEKVIDYYLSFKGKKGFYKFNLIN